MQKFDYKEYIRSLGEELVLQFKRARLSTHNVAKGENKEASVIEKLKSVLPSGVAVGSGFVFDKDGNVSNQCDIILYEKDFAIRCVIDGDERNCYYNVESVIAVGEVKTVISTSEFNDSLKKFDNLSKLVRFREANRFSIRKYCSSMSMYHGKDERTNFDRIFKFIIGEEIKLSFEAICKAWIERKNNPDSLFNYMFDLKGRNFLFGKDETALLSPYNATTCIETNEGDYAFNRFIEQISLFIENGSTVPLNVYKYSNLSNEFNVTQTCVIGQPE